MFFANRSKAMMHRTSRLKRHRRRVCSEEAPLLNVVLLVAFSLLILVALDSMSVEDWTTDDWFDVENEMLVQYIPETNISAAMEILYRGGHDEFKFINFYAPWCSFSSQFMPAWKQFASEAQRMKLNTTVASVDCTRYDYICEQERVLAYPIVKVYKPGFYFPSDFDGNRTVNDLIDHAKNQIRLFGDPSQVE